MGKAIIPGGGGGAPRNSVKVLEYAGEDIPANYFVSKKEGITPLSNNTDMSVNATPTAVLQASKDLILVVYYGSDGRCLKSIKNGKVVATVKDSRTVPNYFTKYGAIVHLPNQRKIIWTTSSDYEYYSLYATVWSYDENGNISLVSDSAWSTTVNFLTLNSDVTFDRINFISGEYSSDYFYAICSYEAASPFKYYLQKYQISGNGFKRISNTEITYSNDTIRPVSCAYSSPAYFEELQTIFFGNPKCSIYDLQTNSLTSFSDDSSLKSTVATSLYDANLFKGYCYCDKKTKKLYIISSSSSVYWNKLYVVDSNTKTIQVLTLTSDNPPSSSSAKAFGPVQNPIATNELFVVVEKKLAKINLSTLKLEVIGALYSSYDYDSLVSAYSFIAGSSVQLFLSTINSSTRYLYLAQYALGTVEIAKDISTIYGISQKNIKTYEQGTIYALSDTQTTSIYGIPQELADAIVDDGIIEVQNEVLAGKEQNNG